MSEAAKTEITRGVYFLAQEDRATWMNVLRIARELSDTDVEAQALVAHAGRLALDQLTARRERGQG
jgi:hypothetical protein